MLGLISGDGRAQPICKVVFAIGRDRSNDLVINNQSVSLFHAQIVFKSPDSAFIRDLHSQNGTFVNDYKIASAPFELRSTNILRFGVCPARFRIVFGLQYCLGSVMSCGVVNTQKDVQKDVMKDASGPAQADQLQTVDSRADSRTDSKPSSQSTQPDELTIEHLTCAQAAQSEPDAPKTQNGQKPQMASVALQTNTNEQVTEKQLLRLVKNLALMQYDRIYAEHGIRLVQVETAQQRQVIETLARVHKEISRIRDINGYRSAFLQLQDVISRKCKAVALPTKLLEQFRRLLTCNIALRAYQRIREDTVPQDYDYIISNLALLETGDFVLNWREEK